MDIIDFHTHTFPDNIAPKAIDKLSKSANIINYLNGTDDGLIQSTQENNISLSVVLPVATRPEQSNDINAASVKKNQHTDVTRLLYFAAIHPEDSNIRLKLNSIKTAGFKGIKLHPAYQAVPINDSLYLHIIDIASELGLITVIHAGYDFSCPDSTECSVPLLLDMINKVHPDNLVLAHMGGLMEWDLVSKYLVGANIYFDTSFSLTPIRALNKSLISHPDTLSAEEFIKIARAHGVDKILFGSDSPWSSQSESISSVINSGLSQDEVNQILASNAKRLLGI